MYLSPLERRDTAGHECHECHEFFFPRLCLYIHNCSHMLCVFVPGEQRADVTR